MALIACPECGGSASSSADACPACGYPVRRDFPPPPGSPVGQAGQIKILHAAWTGEGDPVAARDDFAVELNRWVQAGWEVTTFQVVPIVGPKLREMGPSEWVTATVALNWTAMLTFHGRTNTD